MLETVAWISLAIALACAVIIAADEVWHPQKMAIMNVVWPITALYFSVFALWAYFAKGRSMSSDASRQVDEGRTAGDHNQEEGQAREGPTLSQTALAASHCGAGCVLADIVTEFAVFGAGATLFGLELYASFLWDFVAAWVLGVIFQYFSIQPMRKLPVLEGVWAAMKADTLSIFSFQIGMYGWMALSFFKIFPRDHLHPNEAAYWLMMQVAMICGFVTALPVNWLLVKVGLKEAMG